MKIDRQFIFEKFDGRCAYCGREITITNFQVDHIKPKASGGTDNIDNLNPSCRLCNHYKRSGDIEYLRWLLVEMKHKLDKIYIFNVAEKYGMLEWKNFDGKFYFERIKDKQ